MTDVDERTSAQIIADAEAEIAEADERVQALETAVEDGDENVELEHLEAARKQSAWTRLRLKGAQKKAEAAAQREREQRYDEIVARLIPRALVDLTAEEDEIIARMRPILAKVVALYKDRNTAMLAVAKYATEQSNYRRPEDELTGLFVPGNVGASFFIWRGQRVDFLPPTGALTQALRPAKQHLMEQSAGQADDWLQAL